VVFVIVVVLMSYSYFLGFKAGSRYSEDLCTEAILKIAKRLDAETFSKLLTALKQESNRGRK
jgi:hypothetical protein